MAERYDEQYRGDRGQRNDRGFMERAGDEVRAWFGDDEAERRREMDDPGRDRQGYRERQLGQSSDYGRGPYRAQRHGREDYWRDEDDRSRPSGGTGFRGVSEYGSRYGSNADRSGSERYGSNYDMGQSGSGYGSGANQGYSSGGSYGARYSSYGTGSSQGFQGYGQGTGARARYPESDRDNRSFGESGSAFEGGRGNFAGRGPKGYQRSDARISEDVCDRLAESPDVDASEIEVKVENGEVTLTGSVAERGEKRRAEDLIENISGVREVHNHLRLHRGQGGHDDGLGRTSVLGLDAGANAGATGGSDRPANSTAGASGNGGGARRDAETSSNVTASSTGSQPGITGGGPSGATDISGAGQDMGHPGSTLGLSGTADKTSTAGGRR
jgi:osmotically-inducible protein OsmY